MNRDPPARDEGPARGRKKRPKADTSSATDGFGDEAVDDAVDGGDPGDGLTAGQAKAVDAMLAQPTLAAAAAAAGVSQRTLRRWLRTPAFRSAVLSARREAFAQAIGLTQKYAPAAVSALVKVTQDLAAPPSSRVSAAAVLLKFGREGIELDDLAARVDALEQAAPAAVAISPAAGRVPLRLTTEEA